MKDIIILGSTGSIGKTTLNIIRRHKNEFNVVGLAVAGNSVELLSDQIREFIPKVVAITNSDVLNNQDFRKLINSNVEFITGSNSAKELIKSLRCDIVVSSIVGIAGLEATYEAVCLGREVLLANKESLVVAGKIITEAAKKSGSNLVPLDSEHAALTQLLFGAKYKNEILSLILTASGGPFLNTPLEKLISITPEDAVKHPKWSMGRKISVDSATLVNKALELVEACWLFDIPHEQVKIVVHPQSIVHGIIQLIDGTSLAHMSGADMENPISFGLFKKRVSTCLSTLDFINLGRLDFIEVDNNRFPAILLMRSAIKSGNSAVAAYNCANEVAVDLFLNRKISFQQIYEYITIGIEKFGNHRIDSIDEISILNENIKAELLSLKR
jgi:1-deoxy-D-xylulose-5-phosphate reductoisomerase